MTINLFETPIIYEFALMQEIREALKVDDNYFKEQFRLKLEMANNEAPSDDFEEVLFQSDEAYKNLIDGVKTQEDYNDVYKKVFDVKAVASILHFDMKSYADITEHYIERIQYSDFICPICGEELDDVFVDTLRQEVDDCRTLERFYGEYFERRMKDCERLWGIAKDKGFDKLAWQIGRVDEPMSMREYISSQGNYRSALDELLKDRREQTQKAEKRTQKEMALEWLAKRHRDKAESR